MLVWSLVKTLALLVVATHAARKRQRMSAKANDTRAVPEFDHNKVISAIAQDEDPIKGFLVPGLKWGGQVLRGDRSLDDVASDMLGLTGTAWTTIATMYNPLLGTAVSMLFGFAQGVLNPPAEEVSIADQILGECDRLFTRRMFDNRVKTNQEKLMDISQQLKILTSEDNLVHKYTTFRTTLEGQISSFFEGGCVHGTDADACKKWRQNGATLMTEILFVSIYETLTASLMSLDYEHAYSPGIQTNMQNFIGYLSAHWTVYRDYSMDGANFDKGQLEDTTRWGCQCTTWRYRPGQDKRLGTTMPWTATNYHSDTCRKGLCVIVHCINDEYRQCRREVEGNLDKNKRLYRDEVERQLEEEIEPPIKELCTSLGKSWSSGGGCA